VAEAAATHLAAPVVVRPAHGLMDNKHKAAVAADAIALPIAATHKIRTSKTN